MLVDDSWAPTYNGELGMVIKVLPLSENRYGKSKQNMYIHMHPLQRVNISLCMHMNSMVLHGLSRRKFAVVQLGRIFPNFTEPKCSLPGLSKLHHCTLF
jgi:hypothetical protein